MYRSSVRRVFLSSPLEGEPTTIALEREVAHHLVKVLRLRPGTLVDAADGSGRLFQGRLEEAGEGWELQDAQVVYREAAAPPRILVASLIKMDRFEWVIEKAGELGVDRLIPVNASRSVVEIEARKVSDRVARWQKIADGAVRQSERMRGLIVDAPTSLSAALEATSTAQLLMLDEEVATTPWPELTMDRGVAMFIGPEGGWTQEERETLERSGASRCGLGPSVLRAETAALASMALVHALTARLVRSRGD